MNQEAQEQYNLFLQSGDLFEIFPRMKGDWEKDKKLFLQHFEANREFLESDSNEEI